MKKLFFLTALCLSVMSSNALADKQTINATDTGAQSRTKLNTNFTELYDGKSDKTAVPRYWADWPTASPNNVLAVNTIVAYEGKFYKVIQQITKTGSTADPATLTAYFTEVGKVTAADLGLGTSDNPSFNSVHASSGNLAAANKQVTKAWQTGLSYTASVTSVIHGDEHYIAKTTHTAGSTTEPGVGASWETAWKKVSGAGGGTDYLSLTNTTAFTPDADYEPATKKYVDDAITAGGGYTDEMAQDAVGGMFTGNTETGIAITYDDATAKINAVVDFSGLASVYQPLDSDLTTWAGVTSSANGRSLVSAANYAAMRTLLDLEVGVDFNAYDADLTTWAGITPGTGVGTFLATPSGANLASALTTALPASKGGTGLTALGTGVATALGNAVDGTGGLATKSALDLKANATNIQFVAGALSDMKILTTAQPSTGENLIDDTVTYGGAEDSLRLWSIEKVGGELAGKQAADADLTDLADGSLTGTKVGFADTDNVWTATNVQAALEELNDSINAGAPNGTGAKVHWSQLLGVPAGFADGTDDGAGGGISHATSDGTYYASRNGAWSALTSGNYTLAMTLTANTAITLPTSGTLISSNSSNTLTNKTLDVEGTGNSITIVDKVWFAAAGCNNATATSFYDLPTTNAPAAACLTTSNGPTKGVLDFDAATDESAQVSLALPSDWTGAIDIKYKWLAAATSGNVIWAVDVQCRADAETDDSTTWYTTTATADAAKGTTLQLNDVNITGITTTGCAAGELMHLQFRRDADNASDTMTGDARLIGAELTLRRAQ